MHTVQSPAQKSTLEIVTADVDEMTFRVHFTTKGGNSPMAHAASSSAK